ncbi:hypothetical protein pdam_00007977 [Pocillopora damicornis]|uniref:Uncharacterized protein n=1 Tax=Pocillopora damicornis TaxID=46731 RepID=A0A3M6UFF3_POCDA|nr:hypothetical protein pdam_00007977 [Pocillopora damicornis]
MAQIHPHDCTDANYALYQKQRNKCTSLRRKVIKAYFLNKSETENLNEFWNSYRPFLQSKKSSYFIHVADAAAEINEEDFGTDFSTYPSIH